MGPDQVEQSPGGKALMAPTIPDDLLHAGRRENLGLTAVHG